MKDMDAYFKEIKKQYPKTMNKDQFYRIAHISKATALYLLKSGAVPCTDTGKKTRRYTIRTRDVITYLRERELHPERYKASEGWYIGKSDGKKPKRAEVIYRMRLTAEQRRQFEKFFEAEMKEMADLLTVKDFASFMGYPITTASTFCTKKRIKAFKISGRFLIPKECAINFLVSPSMCQNSHKPYKYKLLIAEFRRQNNIEA